MPAALYLNSKLYACVFTVTYKHLGEGGNGGQPVVLTWGFFEWGIGVRGFWGFFGGWLFVFV